MRLVIRTLVAAAAFLALLTPRGTASTDFPSRPITLIVPFPAGGPSDTIARIVSGRMRASLGQPVIVEDVSGAGGTLGLARVANAEPDGYTLVVGNWASHVGASATFKVSYNVVDDFEPVGMLAVAPIMFVGKSTLPADDMRGLIAWLKQSPNKASAATAGVGSLAHLACVYFANKTDTHFLLVPYRGAAPALQDVVAGQVDLLCGVDASTAMPFVLSGKIKAYAVTQSARWAQAPLVPTVDEAGLPGFYVSSWNGLWAPKGTPKPVIDKLTAAIVETLADPTVREQLVYLGQEIPPQSQQESKGLAEFYRSELNKWLPILKAQKVQAQ